MMESHHIETARYICQQWHKEKKISSYNETNAMATEKRMFHIGNTGVIEESWGNKNFDIKEADQDYWILQYQRGDHMAYAAMLRLE